MRSNERRPGTVVVLALAAALNGLPETSFQLLSPEWCCTCTWYSTMLASLTPCHMTVVLAMQPRVIPSPGLEGSGADGGEVSPGTTVVITTTGAITSMLTRYISSTPLREVTVSG